MYGKQRLAYLPRWRLRLPDRPPPLISWMHVKHGALCLSRSRFLLLGVFLGTGWRQRRTAVKKASTVAELCGRRIAVRGGAAD